MYKWIVHSVYHENYGVTFSRVHRKYEFDPFYPEFKSEVYKTPTDSSILRLHKVVAMKSMEDSKARIELEFHRSPSLEEFNGLLF